MGLIIDHLPVYSLAYITSYVKIVNRKCQRIVSLYILIVLLMLKDKVNLLLQLAIPCLFIIPCHINLSPFMMRQMLVFPSLDRWFEKSPSYVLSGYLLIERLDNSLISYRCISIV